MYRNDYIVALCLMRKLCGRIEARHAEVIDPENSELGREFASAMQGNLACKLAARVLALRDTNYERVDPGFVRRMEHLWSLADSILDADTRSAGQSVDAIMARALVDGIGIQLAKEVMLLSGEVHRPETH
ncbi:hypothetical protein [Methylobacterium sp. 1030]|uniref:hypothetical protein n=1 Tax=Methylobacterium sp. 1030 TaxID=3156404 RepID=UPI0033926A3C